MVYPGHGPETNIEYEKTIQPIRGSVGLNEVFLQIVEGIIIMNTTLEKLKERIKDKKYKIDYATSNDFASFHRR